MPRVILCVYLHAPGVSQQHSFLVGNEQYEGAHKIDVIDVKTGTPLSDLRYQIEYEKRNGMCKRTLIFEEILRLIQSANKSYHNCPSDLSEGTYLFGVDKFLKPVIDLFSEDVNTKVADMDVRVKGKLKEIFALIDVDSSGIVTKEEIKDSLESRGDVLKVISSFAPLKRLLRTSGWNKLMDFSLTTKKKVSSDEEESEEEELQQETGITEDMFIRFCVIQMYADDDYSQAKAGEASTDKPKDLMNMDKPPTLIDVTDESSCYLEDIAKRRSDENYPRLYIVPISQIEPVSRKCLDAKMEGGYREGEEIMKQKSDEFYAHIRKHIG